MAQSAAVVVGSLNYDSIFSVNRLPAQGETMTADGVQFCCGGKGANQAAQCVRLGLPTFMVGAVGTDYMGDALLDGLAQSGVDTAHVKRLPAVTSGLASVLALPGGSVHATIVRGANWHVTNADVDAIEPLLRQAGALLLQLEIPLETVEYAARRAKECGCRVLLNAAPAVPVSRALLAMSDVLMLNEVEAAFYCGQPVSNEADARGPVTALAKELQNTCVFTLGKNGAVAADAAGNFCFCPPCRVHAVETTGAGDSFAGGFACAAIREMPLAQAMNFATCCSGITVQGYGAQAAMPHLAQVEELLCAKIQGSV